MDGKMAPADKMACLLKSCKAIFEMLAVSAPDKPASADEFLPCLIYICLKANPPRIQSNINFITRFCNEEKTRMGEAGYFFANFVSKMIFFLKAFCNISHRLGGITPFGVFSDAFPGLKK
jgi:hypothetical protein